MKDEKDPIEEVTGEVSRIIADNKKFLARFMEEDFEPEEEEEGEEAPLEEL